jgi:putative hydrolase of the HAD superfamily
MMFEAIGFDADDTLWDNESLYHRAKVRFKELLSKHQDPDMIAWRLDEIEVRNVGVYGYGIKSFALSMVEAALEISGGKVDGQALGSIIDISKEMMTAGVELFENAEETVSKLSETYDLMLITKGDQFEQQRKINHSGLLEYFRYIEIVGDKSKEIYRALLEKYRINPQQFLMVGNSLRSDILPVIAIGGKAVYIPNELTWSHETASIEEIDGATFDKLEHLGQLPEYISRVSKT